MALAKSFVAKAMKDGFIDHRPEGQCNSKDMVIQKSIQLKG
ncbi:MAG: hypothetical protein ABIP10_13030 [Ferruginibacter sp.]